MKGQARRHRPYLRPRRRPRSTEALLVRSPLLLFCLGDSWTWFLGTVSIITPQDIAIPNAIGTGRKVMQGAIVPQHCFLRWEME